MITNLTSENFKKVVTEEEDLIIVDFWAPWCGPCKMLGPVLEKLEEEGLTNVGKVNVDEEDAIAQAFNITSIPALFAFRGGKLLGKKVGFVPLPMLRQWVESFKK